MLKRTLVFSNAVNLTLKNRQLVISFKEIEREPTSVPIEDVGCVIIENQRVSITIPLLNALTDNNVQVVFCNEHFMPNSMLLNLDNNITQGETLRNQMAASEPLKKQMWNFDNVKQVVLENVTLEGVDGENLIARHVGRVTAEGSDVRTD